MSADKTHGGKEPDAHIGREAEPHPHYATPWRWRLVRPLPLLLLAIAILHIWSMPALHYPGDNFAIRAEAAYLIETGELGIPYERKAELQGFLSERGQYFFDNEARQRYFSKYGIGYTLLYLPPLLAERLASGELSLHCSTDSQLVFLNLYGVALTLVLAAYLYLLVSLYTKVTVLRVGFVLASIYTTFLWHYLRSPTTEIYHLVTFLGFVYHAVRFIEKDRKPGTPRRWGHLLAATLFAGYSALIKASFVLFFIPLWALAFVVGDEPSLVKRVVGNISRDWRRYALCLALPSVVAAVLFLGANITRCGSPFETGYGQWERKGVVIASFSPTVMKTALRHLLWRFGSNFNAFKHYPLFLFALPGIPLFLWRRRRDGLFLAVLVLTHFVVYSALRCWKGSWCYGPRLFLHPLIVGSLPVLITWEMLTSRRRQWLNALGWAVKVAMLVVLLLSLSMQLKMNAIHYFAFQQCNGMFKQFKYEPVTRYFSRTFHRGLVHADLIAHREGVRTFPPIKTLAPRIPPERRSQIMPRLDEMVRSVAKPNFMF